ncbi:MAG: DsrE family protein [Candidatus Eutrophobiaceae bacterium]
MPLVAFEHDMRLLYRRDGVFRLLRGRTPKLLEFSDCERMMGSFADHGIDTVYAQQEDLLKRKLTADDLSWPVIPLDIHALRRLMHNCDCVWHLA